MSRNKIPSEANDSNVFISIGSSFIINKDFLVNEFINNKSYLQEDEDIEWNKILEMGYKIKSTEIFDYERSVDTYDDYNNLLYKYNFSKKNIKILDCTIRDGGFINGWNFTDEYIEKLLKITIDNNIWCFEIGYLINQEYLNKGWEMEKY